MTTFRCPQSDCGNEWTMEADSDGLYDGFGNPPCPRCGTGGVDASAFRDWVCPEGHTWRVYGNGGLVQGMVPKCPDHRLLPASA